MRRPFARVKIGTRSSKYLLKEFGYFALLALAFLSLVRSTGMSGDQTLRSFMTDLTAPTVHALTKPIDNFVESVRDMSGLSTIQAENARLVQENRKLQQWYQTALRLEAENQSLKSMMNLKLNEKHTFVTANVLMDAGRDFVKSVLLDVARNDGVENGQAVVGARGLVGRVVNVGKNTARVLLINDANARVPVIVANTNQHAILAGDNSDKPLLKHLPQDSEIIGGAKIITSGYAGEFPKGIPVGEVVLENNQVRVHLFSDLSALGYLRVIQDKQTVIRTTK